MQDQPAHPVDVGTGFALWLAALPLLVIGQAVDTAVAPAVTIFAYCVTAVFLVLVCAVVVAFLLLMRQGYRWARTLLTGGGAASIVYVVSSLFSVPRESVSALTFAVTGIVGCVLIAGGMFVLHRKDAHEFFSR